jgi:hypothetical protein
MSIDGIGKPPPVPAPEGPGATRESGGDFRLGESSSVAPSGDLARLERGEIGFDAYLDARVGEATQHLVGHLTPEQLDFVKQALRTELESDPVLVELVQRATGKSSASAAT